MQAAYTVDDFVITVQTTAPSETFTIPTTGGGYDYNVDCDNDSVDDFIARTGNVTCTYPNAGTHTVVIKDNSGVGTGFPRIYFNNGGDKAKIMTIEQWGTGQWASMDSAFYGTINLVSNAADSPDLSGASSMSRMFQEARSLVDNAGSFNNWNTSNIVNMSSVFRVASVFNQDISNWDTSNVTTLRFMFDRAAAFNQPIGTWNTSNVMNMERTFDFAENFDQPIGAWNTSSTNTMAYMFRGALLFDQPIGTWDTRNVRDMRSMFQNASAFNQDIGSWETDLVNNMADMFHGATAFNQDVGFKSGGGNQGGDAWNTGNVTDMNYMFAFAGDFNNGGSSAIDGWNTSSVGSMIGMFRLAEDFNQPIGNWDVSGVTNMAVMFDTRTFSNMTFDQDLSNWDVSSVENMAVMFGTTKNGTNHSNPGDISGWTTSSLENVGSLFYNNDAFDQNLGAWDMTNVTTATRVLSNSALSIANYDATLQGWESQTLQNGVALGADGLNYCLAETERSNIISTYSWAITDAGRGCPNQSPTDIQLDGGNSGTAAENEASGGNIGTLTTTDADVADTHSYSLACAVAGADDSNFNISGDQLRNTTVFDFENPSDANTDGTYEVCVRTNDGNGGTYDETLTVTITDVNVAPTAVSLSANTQEEEQLTNTNIGALSNTDDGEQNTETYTYSLACTAPGADDSHFNILGNLLRNTTVFDYETPADNGGDNVYNVCVRVTEDNGGQSFDQSLLMTVTDRDENAPLISITAPTKVSNASMTDTTVQVTDLSGVNVADVTVDASTTAASSNFSCTQTTATQVDCTVSIDGSGNLVIRVEDSLGNNATGTEGGYVIDFTPPTVGTPTATNITDTSATITWTTDELTSSQVAYGLTTTTNQTTAEIDLAPRVLSHTVTLSGLLACTVYYYETISTDNGGNKTLGSIYSFTTAGCVGNAQVKTTSESNVVPNLTGDGGTPVALGATVEVSVPAGYATTAACADGGAYFQLKSLDKVPVVEALGYPSGKNQVVQTYELSAYCDTNNRVTSFDQALKVTMPIDLSLQADSSSIYRYNTNTNKWEALSNCLLSGGSVTCETTSFSTFGVFGRAELVPSEVLTNAGVSTQGRGRYAGQTREEYRATQQYQGGVTKHIFEEAYNFSREQAQILDAPKSGRILTYKDAQGNEKFRGYVAGRIGVENFASYSPKQVVWRQRKAVTLAVNEAGFHASATTDIVENRLTDIYETLLPGLKKPDQFSRNAQLLASKKITRTSDVKTIINRRARRAHDFHYSAPSHAGDGQPYRRPEYEGWVPDDIDTNRKPIEKNLIELDDSFMGRYLRP